jgi:hypothetical protein
VLALGGEWFCWCRIARGVGELAFLDSKLVKMAPISVFHHNGAVPPDDGVGRRCSIINLAACSANS